MKAHPLTLMLPLGVIVGGATAASAIILIPVLQLLTLFAIIGLTFTTYADVHVVADPADVAACDIVISILDDQGRVLDTVRARVDAGKAVTLRYRSVSGPGETEAIRATVRSWTVPRTGPPGPCPILASMQIVDARSGQTLVTTLPIAQRTERELIPAP